MDEGFNDEDLLFISRYRRQFQCLAGELERLRSSDLQRKKEELRLVSELNSLKQIICEHEIEKQTIKNEESQHHEAERRRWRQEQEQQQREANELKVKQLKKERFILV